jgi:hypothetical protein
MSGPGGSFYFGLLIGDPNLNNFTFTGIYGTNTGVNGLFSGGTAAVPGWLPGTTTNFMIAGWDASMGHDYNSSWATGGSGGDFGIVQGRGIAGNGGTIPALDLFSSLTSFGDLTLRNTLVPEPSAAALTAVGAGVSLLYRRKQKVRAGQPICETLHDRRENQFFGLTRRGTE